MGRLSDSSVRSFVSIRLGRVPVVGSVWRILQIVIVSHFAQGSEPSEFSVLVGVSLRAGYFPG